MPQLDTLTYSSQLFWLGVCFFALYLILAYVVLPKITRIFEKREDTIEEKLNKASTYREQAEDLRADYEEILAQAKEKARQHLKVTSTTISATIANKQKDLLDKLNDRLHIAEQELYRSRLENSKEIESLACDVANTIFLKLTGKAGSFEKDGKNV